MVSADSTDYLTADTNGKIDMLQYQKKDIAKNMAAIKETLGKGYREHIERMDALIASEREKLKASGGKRG